MLCQELQARQTPGSLHTLRDKRECERDRERDRQRAKENEREAGKECVCVGFMYMFCIYIYIRVIDNIWEESEREVFGSTQIRT